MVAGTATAARIGSIYPIRIVFLFSAPIVEKDPENQEYKSVLPLQIQEELDDIVQACLNADLSPEVEIAKEVANFETINRIFPASSLSRRPIDILHFSGHGEVVDDTVGLLLEDDNGAVMRLALKSLKDILAPIRFKNPPCSLAILNSCHSETFAEALIQAGVPHVIAIKAKDSILDKASRTFTKYFYSALLSGESILSSFDRAKRAIRLAARPGNTNIGNYSEDIDLVESMKFILLPEDSHEHHIPIVEEPQKGTVTPPPWDNTNIPPVSPEPFIGRRLDQHRAIAIINNKRNIRCTGIHGMGGMGKTALAKEIGRWYFERNYLQDGAWFFPLRNIETINHAIALITSSFRLSPGTVNDVETLAANLLNKKILLILDDIDSLMLKDSKGFVDLCRTLMSCRYLKLLLTSRENLPGELVSEVYQLGRVSKAASLKMFQKYSRPVSEWGDLEGRDADIERLMKFLDGYPFPIRLAATYMRQSRIDLKTLNSRLALDTERALRFPRSDNSNRDTSLWATLDISYNALPIGAREVFPILSLFPGGISETAAVHIFDLNFLKNLEILFQYSMTEMLEEPTQRRFLLPEPARRYAETLAEEDLMKTHWLQTIAFYEKYINHASLRFKYPAHQQYAGDVIVNEQLNIDHLLTWSSSRSMLHPHRNFTARIIANLTPYWIATNSKNSSAIKSLLKQTLSDDANHSDRIAIAQVHTALGHLHYHNNNFQAALDSYTHSNEIFRTEGKNINLAENLTHIGRANRTLGDLQLSLSSYQEAIEIYPSAIVQLVSQELDKDTYFRKSEDIKVLTKVMLSRLNLALHEYTTITKEIFDLLRESST